MPRTGGESLSGAVHGRNAPPGADLDLMWTSDLAWKARDFAHPWEVVLDRELRLDQKRAILASWASDAAAVTSRPAFRWLAGTPGPIPLSQIRSALLALDRITSSRGMIQQPLPLSPARGTVGYPSTA